MILIPCPHCGARNVSEFAYKGEDRTRPDPGEATPEAWRAYLYNHANPAGWVTETWYHRAGCRRFFTLRRHTVSNEAAGPGVPAGGPR
ncbi:MAG TPA: sarcosine oxidase subunit delta [Acidimicrobiales bacterium]|nr:sarcosine oxidase subunit delta [Acidimicrobiales bacterium]